MGYVLDIAVVAVFALTVFRGYKNGFLHSVIGFVGMIAAVVLAFSLSGPIAEGSFNLFVKGPTQSAIETRVEEAIAASGGDATKISLQAAEESLPGFVKSMMEKNGVTLSSLIGKLDAGTESVAKAIANKVTETVVKPVVVLLVRCIVGIVLLIALLIVAAILGKLLRGILRVTPLKTLDGVLGAVLGALKGVLWALLLVTIMQMIAGFTAPDAVVSEKAIEESVVVSRIAEVNPIYSDNNILVRDFRAAMGK